MKVTVSTDVLKLGAGGGLLGGRLQRLTITPRDGREGAVLSSGEPGRDALGALGLSPGIVAPKAGKNDVKTFALSMPSSLSVNGAEAVKATNDALTAAMKAVRDAYRALAPGANRPAITGEAPAYLTAQIANYQAALARLGG